MSHLMELTKLNALPCIQRPFCRRNSNDDGDDDDDGNDNDNNVADDGSGGSGENCVYSW